MSTNLRKAIVFCTVLAVPAWILGTYKPVIGGPVFGIILGMLIGSFYSGKNEIHKEIGVISKKVLQYAVILLGFGLNLQTVLLVGKTSLPVIVSTIMTSLIVSYIIAKLFNIDSKIATLIGVGSSICGGSAIAATAPVINADDSEIAQSISVIFLFNIIAALIFPTLGSMLGFTNDGFALFAGTAINDTSSVTAAASAWDSIHQTGSMVLDQATIVKLTRTLAIIPITIVLGIHYAKKENRQNKKRSIKSVLPSFIVYFVICSLITTVMQMMVEKGIIATDMAVYIEQFFHIMKKLSKFFIVIAMVAIGLNTDVVKLVKNGGKPIFLGGICWISIIAVSITMQRILNIF